MKMFCQNPSCDFEHEDWPTNAALQFCPRCGRSSFGNVKDVQGFLRGFTMCSAPAAGVAPFAFERGTFVAGASLNGCLSGVLPQTFTVKI